MSNPASDNNFENQCFNPFERNSVLLDNLSDPDFNFFNDNNLKTINTQYCSPDDINTQLITSSENSFSVLHVNIRSISKNFEKLKDLLSNTNFKFKIICLSETWCKDEDVKNNSLFQIPNYSTIHQIRSGDKKGGGVCMFLHNTLVYKLRLDLSINTIDIESLAVEIINKKTKNLIVHTLYRDRHVAK